MASWLGDPDAPERLGRCLLAAVVAACVLTILVRDARQRRRKDRSAAHRLAWRPDACDPIEGHATDIVRMTLLAVVDEEGEVGKAEAWLAGHAHRLTFLSGQGGCGCCTVDWDMEGPLEVIETIPNSLRCDSPWTRRERG